MICFRIILNQSRNISKYRSIQIGSKSILDFNSNESEVGMIRIDASDLIGMDRINFQPTSIERDPKCFSDEFAN